MTSETTQDASAHLPADLAAARVCHVETVGRVSGQPHTIEIWFAADGRTLYLLSGGGDRADWVKNIARTPSVRVTIRGRTFTGAARRIDGDPDEPHARRLVAAKYLGWRDGPLPNEWARAALPIAIQLDLDARAT